MQISKKNQREVLVCSINGEIGLDTVYQLKDACQEILAADHKKVVFNFAKVTYVDSLGMATLAQFSKQLSTQKGELAFCCLSPKLGSIFHIVKLGKVFKIFDSEEEAVKDIENDADKR